MLKLLGWNFLCWNKNRMFLFVLSSNNLWSQRSLERVVVAAVIQLVRLSRPTVNCAAGEVWNWARGWTRGEHRPEGLSPLTYRPAARQLLCLATPALLPFCPLHVSYELPPWYRVLIPPLPLPLPSFLIPTSCPASQTQLRSNLSHLPSQLSRAERKYSQLVVFHFSLYTTYIIIHYNTILPI